MIYLLLIILGLVTGSFLNVIVYRETHQSEKSSKKFFPDWFWGRSYCDHCRKKIAWYDNIPLLSFILLQGKCRRCRQKISFNYPLMEILTAGEFVWIYWLLQQFSFFGRVEGIYSLALLLYWLYIFSSLLVIFIADLQAQIVPDWVVIPAIVISLLRVVQSGRWPLLWSGLASMGFFLFLYLLTKGKGLGFGDVKLGLLMGLFLGPGQTAVAIFLAFLTGAAVGVILILLGKKRFGQKIPFAPFLVAGTFVAKFWGSGLWNWYISLIS